MQQFFYLACNGAFAGSGQAGEPKDDGLLPKQLAAVLLSYAMLMKSNIFGRHLKQNLPAKIGDRKEVL
jgi:hypothetical protein